MSDVGVSIMKKLILMVCGVVVLLWFVFGAFPTFPLSGDISQIDVSWRERDQTATNSVFLDKCLHIRESEDISRLQNAARVVWVYPSLVNSLEGQTYKLDITWQNGRTEAIVITEHEWGASGTTPAGFADQIEKSDANN